MYQIRTDDSAHAVLAVAATMTAALDLLEHIEQDTRDQLVRNGEGAADFWLHLIIVPADAGSIDEPVRAGIGLTVPHAATS